MKTFLIFAVVIYLSIAALIFVVQVLLSLGDSDQSTSMPKKQMIKQALLWLYYLITIILK